MPFTLDQIVPWGRSFGEYMKMFALTGADLGKHILGCGDGPAGFNAVMRRLGKTVVSVDPLYALSTDQIRQRIDVAFSTILEQLVANQAWYVWTSIQSPEHLGRARREAMASFLGDYELGRREGRYVPGELPALPFRDQRFDLCLCSHLLFTYSERLSANFHQKAILEMCRVARDVRVFPLLDMSGKQSPHVDPVCDCLRRHHCKSDIEKVDYEFQRGGNQMLRVISGEAGSAYQEVQQ